MRPKIVLYFLAAALLTCMIPSCASDESTEEYAEKLQKRNQKYYDYNERRRLRLRARQERTDMWFDRIMGT